MTTRTAALLLFSLCACSDTLTLSPEDAGVDAAGPDAVSAADAATTDAALDAPSSPSPESGVDAGPTEPVHFLGRFDTSDPNGPRAAYPGSAIEATFSGTAISVTLHDQNENYFDVSIDGAQPTALHTTNATTSYDLATGLAAGTHTVSLVKRTESFQGIVQFGGFTVTGGAIAPTPFPYTRRIELIGDSITCGYGDVGQGPSCTFSPDTEDEDVAWGEIAGAALGAMHTSIAYSGRGLYRNRDGSTTGLMPDVWTRTFADDATSMWDFSKYAPDAVVINLGTNDFALGDPGAAFRDAYVAFLATVRAKYPKAHIVGVVGPMLGGTPYAEAATYVQNAITASGDPNASYLALPTQDGSDGYGCDWHPSEARQATMGALLAAHLKQALGW